mmetsp:Transcript_79434/g.200765  ORF Transcript_79434/g.200765 Transcript_79434/m.200765 type:complete len:408 (-) Transcript_79434:173-1396(-)
MAASPWSRIDKRGNGRGGTSCLRRWTLVQLASHMAVFYAIISFAVIIQPEWLAAGDPRFRLLVVCFWAVFVATLTLYGFVCFADTRYRDTGSDLSRNSEYESRMCEDCSPAITQLRVKHCQTCGKCTQGFDHHCRYLNVCIGGRTYAAWFWFVVGLWILMATCCYAAIRAVGEPEIYALGAVAAGLFYFFVGVQAVVSGLASLFMISLVSQHIYFICEGITTLEYVKDQAAGFPSLPPRGWREAVRNGECPRCNEELETVEAEDPSEVWYCTICQADVGKAGIEFFTCDSCENMNVCPLCRSLARDPSAAVVTYRVSSLRRRVEHQADKSFRNSSYISRFSSFSSQREPRKRRRTLSAVVAAVEGHTGEPVRKVSFCNPDANERQDEMDDAEDDGSDSSEDETTPDF